MFIKSCLCHCYYASSRGVTIFSAPNYCGLGNTAAFLKFTAGSSLRNPTLFEMHAVDPYKVISEYTARSSSAAGSTSGDNNIGGDLGSE